MNKMKDIYKELIRELNEEVGEGVLTQKDSIQILRADEAVVNDYKPIIDWYYDTFVMEEELSTPLEEMYLPEEFTKEEWKEMVKEQEAYKKQYEECKDQLVSITVKDALTEMKQIVKLF